MIIHAKSHVDHSLTPAQVDYIRTRFGARDGFFIETFELPEELGEVPCSLYGPAVGDDPVHKQATEYARRGDRAYVSRILISGRPRPTRTVTVIAGPEDDLPCILYTAFGGPLAPREPDDPTLPQEQRAESLSFWKEHALAQESQPR